MSTSIRKFQLALFGGAHPSSDNAPVVTYDKMEAALQLLRGKGTSDEEIAAARDILTSSARMDDGARAALENFVNRRAVKGPAEQRQSALDARIAGLTTPGRTPVETREINEIIKLLSHDGATRDERWMAYGWLKSLQLSPGARKALKKFIYQPQTPLPKMDEKLLREALIRVLNNFHASDTLPQNQRPWGNGWVSRPQLFENIDKNHKQARMELGEDVAEAGWRYSIIVANDEKQPSIPSKNRWDSVIFERTNKATGERQVLADSPVSNFVSSPDRYQLEQDLKPFERGDFRAYYLGKERYDALVQRAFPGKSEREEIDIVKVTKRRDGNLDVVFERRSYGADLRKIDPKLRMWADRAGHKIVTKDDVERVTMIVSPFGIAVE